MPKAQCSDIFESVFDSHVGGCIKTCACGITHFDVYNDDWDWEEGEFEGLLENARTNPKEYQSADGAVGTMTVDMKEIVYGCTCDLAERYESFILNHTDQLAEYLNKLEQQKRDEADSIKVGAVGSSDPWWRRTLNRINAPKKLAR